MTKIKNDFVPLKVKGYGNTYRINSQGVVVSYVYHRPHVIQPTVLKNKEIVYKLVRYKSSISYKKESRRLKFLYKKTFGKEISEKDIEFLKSEEFKKLRLEWNEKHKKKKKQKTINSLPKKYTRRCHDCGRPTNNYRCDNCWAKIRGTTYLGEELTGEDWLYQAELSLPKGGGRSEI